ncbi:HamA C-terminal domain-containing protein [Streptomyces sp. IBSBF 2435]|uniref:HamA C-terminal domain-containing protein n=1 Tax=Streptomyces sp. IBSBF 2435 TaxID=2903531 RepID=UPI002FDBF2E8
MFTRLPEFALSQSEAADFDSETGVEMLSRAVKNIYLTDKYHRRGEFGELLLHVVLREVFGTEIAISKIFFKDSHNDTVKGFDAVHVVVNPQGNLELWLGEVKFYDNLARAIRDVVSELHAHVDSDYLRSEFAAIGGKIDPSWVHADEMKQLIANEVSLDEVFDNLTIPVLLTYDSRVVAERVRELSRDLNESPSSTAEAYRKAFEAEIRAGWERFATAGLPRRVRIRLILVPLHEKKTLLSDLHERLRAWQQATA